MIRIDRPYAIPMAPVANATVLIHTPIASKALRMSRNGRSSALLRDDETGIRGAEASDVMRALP